ncbi:hypothetical protein MWU57_12710, partial [Isoptericola sp. S6320L]
MAKWRSRLVHALIVAVGVAALSSPAAAEETAGTSSPVTWSCTGDPCPWGAQLTGNAAVWPD